MDGDQIYGANICKYMGMKILLYIYICVCAYTCSTSPKTYF